MPIKKTWLLRLPEIRAELTAMEVPVVDRAVFERVFGVRRRRAIQSLHHFGGFQAGRMFLIDRLALLRQLEPLAESAEFALEQQRRQRLIDFLENACGHAGAFHGVAAPRRCDGMAYNAKCDRGL